MPIPNYLKQKYAEDLERRKPHEARTPQVDMDACERINKHLTMTRVEMAKGEFDHVEAIALAAHKAFDDHEQSYDPKKREYRKDIETCLIEACAKMGIDPRLIRVIDLAASSSNDMSDWADDILAGRPL